MPYATLHTRRLIRIAGEDAQDFLQGVLTCDVRPAWQGQAAYGALLTPQGKFLHDLFLMPWGDGVALDCDGTRYADLLSRLKMYRLRSKVEMDVLADNDGIIALWGDALPPGLPEGSVASPDPRLPDMGWRIIGDTGKQMAWLAGLKHVDEVDYHHHRLQCAIPDGVHDMVADKSLLMEYGFDRLQGVDFTKGCYIGQEVTARSKHRGQVRKALYSVCISGALPPSGTNITCDGQEVGQLRSVSGGIGLAFLQIEAVEKSQNGGAPLLAGNTPIEVALPKWLREQPAI